MKYLINGVAVFLGLGIFVGLAIWFSPGVAPKDSALAIAGSIAQGPITPAMVNPIIAGADTRDETVFNNTASLAIEKDPVRRSEFNRIAGAVEDTVARHEAISQQNVEIQKTLAKIQAEIDVWPGIIASGYPSGLVDRRTKAEVTVPPTVHVQYELSPGDMVLPHDTNLPIYFVEKVKK